MPCLKWQGPHMPKEHAGSFSRDKVISAASRWKFWILLFFSSLHPSSNKK